MTNQPQFYFDFGSPATYLAWKRLPDLEARTGVTFELVPMLLGGVFKATGNASPVTVPAKGAWMGRDLARWAERHGTPFRFNPHFPINTLRLMRGAIAAEARGELTTYADAVFDAIWQDQRNVGDPAEVAAVLTAAGLDAAAYAAAGEDDAVKARLVANTQAAVAAGIFGAPSFLVAGELYFGQDRMDFVEAAILSAQGAAA
ncbi:MAG: 2-hydroxychromene-2-carboxylate isomerase [Novosphingobium sp.]